MVKKLQYEICYFPQPFLVKQHQNATLSDISSLVVNFHKIWTLFQRFKLYNSLAFQYVRHQKLFCWFNSQEKEQQAAKLESNLDEDQEEMKVDASVEGSTEKPEDGSAEKPAENPDEDGMKKMRQDFFANMSK